MCVCVCVCVLIENFLEASAEVPEIPFPDDAEDESKGHLTRPHQRQSSPLPAPPRPLAEELEREERERLAQHSGQLEQNGKMNGNGVRGVSMESETSTLGGEEEEEVKEDEEEWYEEDSFLEEMLAVEPLTRTEVDMLQKEKETWEADRSLLESEKKTLREQKEALEQ